MYTSLYNDKTPRSDLWVIDWFLNRGLHGWDRATAGRPNVPDHPSNSSHPCHPQFSKSLGHGKPIPSRLRVTLPRHHQGRETRPLQFIQVVIPAVGGDITIGVETIDAGPGGLVVHPLEAKC